jgi:hypothetical protein
MRWTVTQVYASDQTTLIMDGNDLKGIFNV